jgi:integrase
MRSINNGPALVTDTKPKDMSTTTTIKLVLAGAAYQLFIDSCRSPKTKQTYEASLRSYMLFRKVSSVEPLLAEDIKQAQSKVIEFINAQRRNGLSWQTCVIRAAALKHFYEMNDITLNWKKINRFIGEKARTIQDRAYTKEEIRRMLEKCDERKRVMLLVTELLTFMDSDRRVPCHKFLGYNQ